MKRLFLCFICLRLVLACAPNPTVVLTAEQIAQRAADKMQTINSFHFSIDVSGRSKAIDALGTLLLRRAEGDVLRPDRAKSRLRVSLGGLLVEVQAVAIREQQWLTNPLTQRWEPAPAGWGYNPAVLFDPQRGLASLLNRARNLSRGPDDTLDNQRHYRLSGTAPTAEVAAMTASMVTGSDVSFTVWVGADDSVLRRLHITERNAGDKDATEWEIVLSGFGQPITIDPPKN
jgi:lipoprotein LprG